jgi:hypothetical protein
MRTMQALGRLVTLAAALAAPSLHLGAQPQVHYKAGVYRSQVGPITEAQGSDPVAVTGAQGGIGNGGTSTISGAAHAGPLGLGAVVRTETTILPGLTLFEIGDARATVRADDLVFKAPTAAPFTTSLYMALDGFIMLSHPDNATGARVRSDVALAVWLYNNGAFSETGHFRYSSSGDNLATGLFELSHLSPGMIGQGIGGIGVSMDGWVRTSSFTVTPNVPSALELSLEVATSAGGTSFGAPSQSTWALSDFSNTLTFRIGAPVFDLPPGYSVDSPSLGIVDNRWVLAPTQVPEPATVLLLGVGIAALGVARMRRYAGSTANSRSASRS